MTEEQVSLFYKEAGSDKEYNASLTQTNEGWVVNFAYGRRGSSLKAGTKTASPVPYEKAKKIYDGLVVEKTRKGYTEQAGGKSFSGTVLESRDTNLRLQLLNEIEEEEIEEYLDNPDFCAQEKHDGQRRGIIKQGSTITGTNRKGLSVTLSDHITEDLQSCQEDFTLDGEDLGQTIQIFDILETGGSDARGEPYSRRLELLDKLFQRSRFNVLQMTYTALTSAGKRNLYQRLRQDGAEGIVFKRLDSPYTAGRPNSGGNQIKFKFYSTASAIVMNQTEGKRSVSLYMVEDKLMIPIGKVTIPPNYKIPPPGAIVEVRYLYYYPGGALFQPVYLGERDDIGEEECSIKQLKAKVPKEDDLAQE